MAEVSLDDAVRQHLASYVDDGEVIASWMVLAATRSAEDGGVVLVETSEAMPQWEARGVLATAMRSVNHSEDDDQP